MKRRGAQGLERAALRPALPRSLYVVILIYPAAAGHGAQLPAGRPVRRRRRFVGLDNYARLFADDTFVRSILNTFLLALMIVPLLTVIALALALALNRATRGAAIFRGIFFSSSVLSVTIVTLIWRFVLAPDAGLLGETAQAIGRRADPVPQPSRPGRSGRWRSRPSGGRSACR